MKIQATLVGLVDHSRTLDWPEGWPVPRVGDEVTLATGEGLAVRTVVWYPEGDEDGDPEPFVYVVVGQPRPR